jgi:arylsulfatase A-like enzyme
MPPTRRDTLGALAGISLPATAGGRKPNVVLIMGDDLGYCDTELYGCTDIPTPHIKSIARDGVLFTSGYVSAPVCSPSRAGLMTGRYQQRFGFEFNAGPLARAVSDKQMGLPESEITFAQVMKRAGYATGMVGKWHLGMHEAFHPLSRGFDEFFGFLFGANSYVVAGTPGARVAGAAGGEGEGRNSRNPVLRNREPVEERAYLTEAFAREAVAYIERRREHPFFLYVPFNAPHTPLETTDKYYARFPNVKDQRRRIYCSMVSALDDAVGAILAKLRDTGLERDTLVVFLSDNGCATYTNCCTNLPLRFGKLTHLEGGFRVPFAMRLPGRLKAGTVCDDPVSSLDLLPTAAALAGARLPAGRDYDGVDLLPHLTGVKKTPPHDVLCWRSGPNSAVRKGNWKLYQAGAHSFLFDLSKDIGEATNIAAKNPRVVDELKSVFAAWERTMRQPLWPSRKAQSKWPFEGIEVEIHI